ncbi:FAD-dependent oxidoreductase domain-containing protein 2-like [Saccoglossus kowalevskii]|uniref:FAD-dependent oxidoreductase domain-containing protein 2-like n=1 Tax=Saccoglossus kowalevskii TaxID=10224 RepID=A0ABM0M946_SACKO|nr:PREDICTED: FAD-dependent oxidoreductase domain-containing protein 2-like [Saccoglossus kowalevskii]
MLPHIVWLIWLYMQVIITNCTTNQPELKKDYCIIGAGPSGLQLGYFLHKAGRDYLIFERTNTSGAFFIDYPRHRTMISINKRNTGKTNKEFNLRHDWNSLLSDDDSLQMRHYSHDFFPHADVFVKYLQDYTEKHGINVKYNTNIVNVKRRDKFEFQMQDQSNNTYDCGTVIVGTGLSLPNIPHFKGVEHTVGYEDMSMDKADYEGKTVLIMGKGNSGFETADYIMSATNFIHMFSRTPYKLAWNTHYVGVLRNRTVYTYIEEFPVNLLDQLRTKTGHDTEEVLVIIMQYGKKRFLKKFTGIPGKAHLSYFLHPVLYYYDELPSSKNLLLSTHV